MGVVTRITPGGKERSSSSGSESGFSVSVCFGRVCCVIRWSSVMSTVELGTARGAGTGGAPYQNKTITINGAFGGVLIPGGGLSSLGHAQLGLL